MKKKYQKGMTLIEIVMILIIIGLLIGGGIGLLSILVKHNKLAKTLTKSEQVYYALIGYVMNKGRFPCPDKNGDGKEDCPVSSCNRPPCFLPYATIGISMNDSWGRKFYYDVASDILTETRSIKEFCLYSHISSKFPYVTNGNTTYKVAAVIISAGAKDADNDGNVLDGRNSDKDHIYEMESKKEKKNYDDLVKEISLNYIISKICEAEDKKLKIYISGGTLCYNETEYNIGDEIKIAYGEDVKEGGCKGTSQKNFIELLQCEWNASPIWCNEGSRDGKIIWNNSSWYQ